MHGNKCRKIAALCPISFGLALGITTALMVFLCMAWMMYHGVPPMMEAMRVTAPTSWGEVWVDSLWALLKGFLFGLVLALFYDLFVCCSWGRCKKSGGCGCNNCSTGDNCGCNCNTSTPRDANRM